MGRRFRQNHIMQDDMIDLFAAKRAFFGELFDKLAADHASRSDDKNIHDALSQSFDYSAKPPSTM
jgi:hypothetical protein